MILVKILNRNRAEIIICLLGILSYFSLRLYNLMSLPLFTDEAIYIRWAQIAKNDANWRFISLVDGKQPSFVWLMMIVMRFVLGDRYTPGALLGKFKPIVVCTSPLLLEVLSLVLVSSCCLKSLPL